MRTQVLDSASVSRTVVEVAPALIVSVAVAETFFKFGSFTREFVCWAVVFGALYGLQKALVALVTPKPDRG